MLYRVPIRNKLLLVFCLVVLPLVGITALGAHRQWQQRRESLLESHQETAQATADALLAFLQNFADTQEAMGIATRRDIRTAEAFHDYIADVARANTYLLGYAVITRAGRICYSDPPQPWWRTLRDHSDIAAVDAGHTWGVSNLQRTVDEKPVVTISTPLPGSSQLLRAAIDVSALKKLLHLSPRPGWRVSIVDAAGRLVYHGLDPDRSWAERDWRQDAAVREARCTGGSRADGYRSLVDGEWCLGSYRRVDQIGWVVGSSCPTEQAMAPVRAALATDCWQIAVAVVATLLITLLVGARLSRPIERLAAAAATLGQGEGEVVVPVHGQDELAVLARAFNTMGAQIREREERLRASLEREQTIASTLQRAFLPQRFPGCPGYTFGAGYHPALREAEVGGDFYDVFPLPDGRFGLLLGDVSGKGVAAAVYAAMTRYLVRAYALQMVSPGEVVGHVNRALVASIEDPEVFVTAFYGVLDPKVDTLCYANAGHWPALWARAQGTELVGGHNLALGIRLEADYQEGCLVLEQGDELLLYTDGLVEIDGDDPIGQLEALQETLWQRRDEPPPRLVDGLYLDVARRGAETVRDDIALLVIRCEKQPRPATEVVGRVERPEERRAHP